MNSIKIYSGGAGRENSRRFEPLLVAAVVIALSALAYLPLIDRLGYYHDDWFTVASYVSDVSLAQVHSIDRPLMGQLYSTA